MTQGTDRGPASLPRWGVGFALGTLASLLGHGAFLLYVSLRLSTPDVGLSFELPQDVEFGLTEAVEVEAAPAPGEAEPEAEPDTPGAAGDGSGDTEASDEEDAAEGDAQDAPPPPRKPERPQPEGDGFGTRALPPGAQLALRMDMTRIRTSPLATNIKRMLANVPDWQAVLGGSGLEPVDDLARVLIASPNLHRSKVVIAGRHEGDPALPRDIVARMAAARGVSAEWSQDEGVPVAPWPDRDTTERRIALIGDHHFAISRPEDLPRVLAIAQARQARAAGDDDAASLDPEAWGEALLSLEEDEALTLEVEGARHFVRGPMADRFPTRLRIAIEERPNGRVRISAVGTYDTRGDAEGALAYAERVREAYARNVLLRMAVGSALQEAVLEQDGETVTARTDLTLDQVRFLLGYVEGFLARGQAPPRPGAPAAPDEDATGDPQPAPNPYR